VPALDPALVASIDDGEVEKKKKSKGKIIKLKKRKERRTKEEERGEARFNITSGMIYFGVETYR